jgi:hypothetical protein
MGRSPFVKPTIKSIKYLLNKVLTWFIEDTSTSTGSGLQYFHSVATLLWIALSIAKL